MLQRSLEIYKSSNVTAGLSDTTTITCLLTFFKRIEVVSGRIKHVTLYLLEDAA